MWRSAVLLVVLLVACSGGSDQAAQPPSGKTTVSCAGSLPFTPGSIPARLEPTPASGVGGGGEVPTGTSAFHFRGSEPGRFIDIIRGQGRYALSDASPVMVLGTTG